MGWLVKTAIKLLLGILLLVGVIYFVTSFKEPKMDRNWSEESKLLPDVIISTSTLEVKKLRDFRYDKEGVIESGYYDEAFDLEKIDKTYFLVNKFGFKENIAHTFFVFTFSDGKEVSVSVEARREVGVPYSAVKGLFHNYELWYIWGSPADFLSRRAVLFNDDLAMYELQISTSTARALILDLAKETEKLETEAIWYNTVTENCTNVLADSANRINPGSIPWNIGRVVTGFADVKLHELGLIRNDKLYPEIYKESLIDKKIREFMIIDPKMEREEFWDKLLK